MNDYWRGHFDLNADKFPDQLLKQVGKTVNGQEVSEEQVKLIIGAIKDNLKLTSSDAVIDLCCGNGVLTKKISTMVREVLGVDFSINLIQTARNSNRGNNINYVHANIQSLEKSFFQGRNKIYMYEGMQHLLPGDLEDLLGKLQSASGITTIFLGGIPDREKLKVYYDTPEKFEYYLRCEKEGRPHMGYWWLKDEMTAIAADKGFLATHLSQAPSLYTSYYRFDCLLEKL